MKGSCCPLTLTSPPTCSCCLFLSALRDYYTQLYRYADMGPVLRRRIVPRPLLSPGSGLIHTSPHGRGGAIQPIPTSNASFCVRDVSIPEFVDYSGAIYFQIHVFALGEVEYVLSRRYSEFHSLHSNVSYWMPFPTKASFPQKSSLSWMISPSDEELRQRTLGLNVRCSSLGSSLISLAGLAERNCGHL